MSDRPADVADSPGVPPAVAAVADALSTTQPLSVALDAFAARVVLHMGPVRARIRPQSWINWVEFLRSEGGVAGLRTEFDHVEVREDGTVLLRGRWVGRRDGQAVASGPSDVVYRVSDERIVELWTSPRNYTLLFGRASGTLPGFVIPYLRFRRWSATRASQEARPVETSP